MSSQERIPLDMDAIRQKLEGKSGREYWQSLQDLADTPEFQKVVEDEFPRQARPFAFDLDRRQFMKLIGGSLALAGLSGCRYLPRKKIVPYVRQPEELVLGLPLQFATASTFRGYGTGVLATSHEGRPTKLEGNPDHPASLGKLDSIGQASIMNLYDPDRSTSVHQRAEVSTWDFFVQDVRDQFKHLKGGEGFALLTETITSPTMASQLARMKQKYPAMKWYAYEPFSLENVQKGAEMAAGQPASVVYHFDKAQRIVSFDCDFLSNLPGSVRYARDFSNMRRLREGAKGMSRFYCAESSVTLTGANADIRIPLRPSQVETALLMLGAELGVCPAPSETKGVDANWIRTVAADLKAHHGASLVLVGEQHGPEWHALAHAITGALGGLGSTVSFHEPVEVRGAGDIQALAKEMDAGNVKALAILGANPVFDAPADLAFADKMAKVSWLVHLGSYLDETGRLCTWHLPESHYLEAWGDVRAFDGTASIVQPLIEPLYESRSAIEVMEALVDRPRLGYDIVRDYWKGAPRVTGRPVDFETTWAMALNKGVMSTTPSSLLASTPNAPTVKSPVARGLEYVFQPDSNIWDGRFANNGWLQEQPRNCTLLSWDNAILLSVATAKELGVDYMDVVDLKLGQGSCKGPVWIVPSHPDGTVTVIFGGGRTNSGVLGNGAGFNAYPLRTTASPMWTGSGIELTKTGETQKLISTQDQHSVRGSYSEMHRDLVREGTLEEFLKEPEKIAEPEHHEEPLSSMFEAPEAFRKYDGYQWGMTIDLSTCIGCNACMTACQAENNIPIVGKDQVSRGRIMNWIRVDRYWYGETVENPKTLFMPVPCMHCEMAPCEPVCPVGATVHSHEGLNQMVYNRCIGTKYCSNNCPYKVRRFNFYKYVAGQPNMVPGNFENQTIRLLANPDVTVRGRGVMEKCTYCVQRINSARIAAKNVGRTIRDGEVVPACAQTCPTDAIVFGNINDKNSRVSKEKAQPQNYTMLDSLNTRPRTTYLAKVRNPNGGAG